MYFGLATLVTLVLALFTFFSQLTTASHANSAKIWINELKFLDKISNDSHLIQVVE